MTHNSTGWDHASAFHSRRKLAQSQPTGLLATRVVIVVLLLCCSRQIPRLHADDPVAKLTLLSPMPHQVIQRTGFDPSQAHEHSQAELNLGYSDVRIIGKDPAVAGVPDMAKSTLGMPSAVAGELPGPKYRLAAGHHDSRTGSSSEQMSGWPLAVGIAWKSV